MRHLLWPSCYNVRDLGGYPTRDGRRVRERVFIRSDSLQRLTAEGQAELVDYGVRTIIDLRAHAEVAAHPNPFANGDKAQRPVRYLNLSLAGDPNDPDASPHARAVESLRDGYCLALDENKPSVERIITAIAQAPDGGVLVHCHAGRDRTGLIAALVLATVGVPEKTIVEDYALSDSLIQPLHELHMQTLNEKERERFLYELTLVPETMRSVLQHLADQYGGAEGYLAAAGVTDETLERLRNRLIEG